MIEYWLPESCFAFVFVFLFVCLFVSFFVFQRAQLCNLKALEYFIFSDADDNKQVIV